MGSGQASRQAVTHEEIRGEEEGAGVQCARGCRAAYLWMLQAQLLQVQLRRRRSPLNVAHHPLHEILDLRHVHRSVGEHDLMRDPRRRAKHMVDCGGSGED